MDFDELKINILKAMAHPVRYNIIKSLYDGSKCVCKLNEEFEYSQANLSQHLRILKDAKILKSKKVGLKTHYSLYDQEVKDILMSIENYTEHILKK